MKGIYEKWEIRNSFIYCHKSDLIPLNKTTNHATIEKKSWENFPNLLIKIWERTTSRKKWLTKRKSKSSHHQKVLELMHSRKGSNNFLSFILLFRDLLHNFALIAQRNCSNNNGRWKNVFAALCQLVNFPFVDVKWFGDSWKISESSIETTNIASSSSYVYYELWAFFFLWSLCVTYSA